MAGLFLVQEQTSFLLIPRISQGQTILNVFIFKGAILNHSYEKKKITCSIKKCDFSESLYFLADKGICSLNHTSVRTRFLRIECMTSIIRLRSADSLVGNCALNLWGLPQLQVVSVRTVLYCITKSPGMTEMSSQVNGEIVVHPHNGILCTKKKEQTVHPHNT